MDFRREAAIFLKGILMNFRREAAIFFFVPVLKSKKKNTGRAPMIKEPDSEKRFAR